MRIVRVEVIPIALPFRERYLTASGELEERTMAIVRIHTDSGAVGLGEAVPLSLRGGPSLANVVLDLNSICGPALIGADASPALTHTPSEIRTWIWELLERCRQQRAGTQAIAAIDVGLHDLAGRLSGLPMWRVLGAAGVREVEANASIDARSAESAGKLAEALAEVGFRTFKIKVGSGEDLDRVIAVRNAVPQGSKIRIDANGAWEPNAAVTLLREFHAWDIELVEQPCSDLGGLAEVRRRTPIAVVADESVASAADAERARAMGACDVATVKLAKVGGPLEALSIAAILPVYLSSALDGPIGIAAALHTAQVMPRGGYAGGLAQGLGTLTMFSASYASSEGLFGARLSPARAPGLGVEIDEGALQALRLP